MTQAQEAILNIINLLENYNVLIDVGSFLRNYSNSEFAFLVSYYNPNKNMPKYIPKSINHISNI